MLIRMNGAPFPVSAGYGDIDSVHTTPHSGIDIAMPEGTPLSAVGDGVITKVDVTGAHDIGRMVRVDLDNGPDVVYGHMSQVNVKVGDHVSAGDVLGLSGNTGHSTGPHLHVQMISDSGANLDPTVAANMLAAEPSGGGGIFGHLREFADWVIGKEASIIVKPATSAFGDFAHNFLALINSCSAEIITLGLIVCGVGVMLGPMVGGSKWIGRLFVVFWGGVIWRVLT